MKLVISKKADINYLAKVVNINSFHDHPNADKLKQCSVGGFNVIVGIDYQPGLYIYFPALSQINSNFLSYANLYRHEELNSDTTKSGLFKDNGRVEAVKLRGEVSEGFLIPADIFTSWIITDTNLEIENLEDGIEFDSIRDEKNNKEFWACKKFVPKNLHRTRTEGTGGGRKRKVKKEWSKVIDTQFRFHYQTALIRKYPTAITPDDIISITSKVNGTSGISAYVLCKKKMNWKDKIVKWLTKEEPLIYDYIYSSRTVIKNPGYNPNVGGGYYGVDVWKYADEVLKPYLQKGMSFYYEILGYLPTGKYIQNHYDYGFKKPTDDNYQYGVHFGIQIYRITMTNVDGLVHEFSAKEVQVWCKNHGLIPVEEFYYGRAGDLYPDLDPANHWGENFIDRLANDKNFYMELDSPVCKNKVPHEGIVIKKENMQSAALKLKTFRHLGKEQEFLDKGEADIEMEN